MHRPGSSLTSHDSTKAASDTQPAEVMRLRAEGKSASDIAKALGISRASVFRIVAENPVN